MSQPDMRPYFNRILDDTSTYAKELAAQKCSKVICGLQGAVASIPEPIQLTPNGDVAFIENIQHGIACEYAEECHFAQHPVDVTNVFTEAMHRAMAESGMGGFVNSPDARGLPRDN